MDLRETGWIGYTPYPSAHPSVQSNLTLINPGFINLGLINLGLINPGLSEDIKLSNN